MSRLQKFGILLAVAAIVVAVATVLTIRNLPKAVAPPKAESESTEVQTSLQELLKDEPLYRRVLVPSEEQELLDRLRRFLGLPPGTEIDLLRYQGGSALLSKDDRHRNEADEQLVGRFIVPGKQPVHFSMMYPPRPGKIVWTMGHGMYIYDTSRRNRIAKLAAALGSYPDQSGVRALPIEGVAYPQELLVAREKITESNSPFRIYLITPDWQIPTTELSVLASSGRLDRQEAQEVFAADLAVKRVFAFQFTEKAAQQRVIKQSKVDGVGTIALDVDGLGAVEIQGAAPSPSGAKLTINGKEVKR